MGSGGGTVKREERSPSSFSSIVSSVNAPANTSPDSATSTLENSRDDTGKRRRTTNGTVGVVITAVSLPVVAVAAFVLWHKRRGHQTAAVTGPGPALCDTRHNYNYSAIQSISLAVTSIAETHDEPFHPLSSVSTTPAVTRPSDPAFRGPWSQNIVFADSSRSVRLGHSATHATRATVRPSALQGHVTAQLCHKKRVLK